MVHRSKGLYPASREAACVGNEPYVGGQRRFCDKGREQSLYICQGWGAHQGLSIVNRICWEVKYHLMITQADVEVYSKA